jgi:hypothetical protein
MIMIMQGPCSTRRYVRYPTLLSRDRDCRGSPVPGIGTASARTNQIMLCQIAETWDRLARSLTNGGGQTHLRAISSGQKVATAQRSMRGDVPNVGLRSLWLTYRATVDLPARFRSSKAVGGGVRTNAVQVSIGRDRPNRRDIAVRQRDDAGDDLRSGPYPTGAHDEMVLA